MFLFPENPYKCRPFPVFTTILAVGMGVLWLIAWGLSYPQELFSGYGFIAARPRGFTIITSLFLHRGLLFIMPSLFFIPILGKQFEDVFGRFRYFTISLLSGIAGTALFYALNRTSTLPCTGSCGAVSSLVAAFWVAFADEVFDIEVHLVDRNADVSEVLVLKTVIEKYSPGSETRRAVTTVTGTTKLKVHIQLVTRDGHVVMERAVEGDVRFIGDNLRATNKVANNTAKILKRTTLPAAAVPVPQQTTISEAKNRRSPLIAAFRTGQAWLVLGWEEAAREKINDSLAGKELGNGRSFPRKTDYSM